MFQGGGAVIPACGSNGAKSILEFGFFGEAFSGGKLSGNGLPVNEPFRGSKWLLEQRRRGAGVAQAVRRLRFVHGHGIAFDHRIVNSVSGTDAGFPGAARNFRQHAVFEAGRIRQAKARRETIAGWHQSAGHALVADIDQAYRRVRIDDRLFPGELTSGSDCISQTSIPSDPSGRRSRASMWRLRASYPARILGIFVADIVSLRIRPDCNYWQLP